MKDAKVYFEDLDPVTKEVIIDLFVSALENKLRALESGQENEKPGKHDKGCHSERKKSQT
jgi:hypothetical protein